jgi:hypothetical protein
MDRAELIKMIKRLLNVVEDLTFLEKLGVEDLERLTAYIRDRIENPPPKFNKQ